MKKIGLVGSTGSIGSQTVNILNDHKDEFEIVFLTCHRNIDLFSMQCQLLAPKYAIVTGVTHKENMNFLYGLKEVERILKSEAIDLLIIAASGVDILPITVLALQLKINVATANKESIVIAGNIIMETAANNKSMLLPIDSEHSAIFQCLMGQNEKFIEKIYLTASGGPLLYKNKHNLETITPEEALKHPVWAMGNKISIDSATMINKGFELIEAHFLFNVDHSQLDVLIHPQSIIHSLVTFVDGSVIAQASLPDMRIPISFAIAYPERLTNKMPFLNLADYNNIEFMKPDYEKFTLLKLSMEILKSNCNSYNIGLEAANAVAVESFLKGTINFLDIYIIIKKIVDYIEPINILAINNILQFREEIVIKTRELIKKLR